MNWIGEKIKCVEQESKIQLRVIRFVLFCEILMKDDLSTTHPTHPPHPPHSIHPTPPTPHTSLRQLHVEKLGTDRSSHACELALICTCNASILRVHDEDH